MKTFFGKPTLPDAEPGGLHMLALVVPLVGNEVVLQRGQPYGQKEEWSLPMDTMEWNEPPADFARRMLASQVLAEIREIRLFDARSYPAKAEKDHWHLFLVFRADLEGEVTAGPDCAEVKRVSPEALPEPLYFFDRGTLLGFVEAARRSGPA